MKKWLSGIIALSFILLTIHQTVMAQQATAQHIEWKIATQLPAPPGGGKQHGVAGAVAGVHNDVLLVAGGANFPGAMPWRNGKKKYYTDIYVFEKNGEDELRPAGKTFQLPFELAYSAAVSTQLGVVAVGGENESGTSDKVLLLQWDNTRKNIAIRNLPSFPIPITNAAATTDGHTIFVAGGESANGATDGFYSLDLRNLTAGWNKLPALPRPASHAVLAMQFNGLHPSVYFIGGRKKNSSGASDLYPHVYEYNPYRNSWILKAQLPYSLSAGTGMATDTHSILLFGGDKGETFRKAESLIAAISLEKDEVKKEELNQRKIALQEGHPGFSNEVLRYNTLSDQWTVVGSAPFAVPVTTTIVRWGNAVLFASGEVRPGVRTPQILAAALSRQ